MKKFFLFVCFSILAISNFSIKNGKVFYENKYGKEIVKKADSKTFEILPRKDFAKDKNHVYMSGIKLENADPATFKKLDGMYAKDKNSVYVLWYKIREADPATFQILNSGYSKDKNHVYFQYENMCARCAYTFIKCAHIFTICAQIFTYLYLNHT